MRLKDVCNVFLDGDWIENKDQSPAGIRLIQTGNIGNGIFLEKKERARFISEETFARLKCNEIFPGDILVSRLPDPIGRACIIPDTDERMITAVDCTICRVDKSMILPEFLCYFMRSAMYYNAIMENVTGTTRKRISRKNLGNVNVRLFPLDDQQAIVHKLDYITKIIKLRKKELAQLDYLIKARFVEMFGDPKANPFEWTTSTVGELILSCEAGWSGNGMQRKKKDGEIAVLKVSAVTKGYFDFDECKVLDDQDIIKKYVYPQAGDLLFSRANTREMVGATAVITQDYPEHILSDKLWRVRFCDAANVWYMKYVLSSKSIRSIFSSVSNGTSGSMFNVSMGKFKSIRIPLPPIELQQQFADFVTQVDKSKVVA